MILNVSYDQPVGSLPADFVTTINAVVSFFQSTFTDSVTVNIDVGYGEVDNQRLSGGALGESITVFSPYTYTQIKNALSADATSADDASAVASLGSDPTGGGHYWVTTAEAEAMGLSSTSNNPDGFVGFSNSPGIFDYDNSNGVSPGAYDFYGVVAHEFSEVMGRQLEVGANIGGQTPSYEPLDLFHFSAPNTRVFTQTTGYFSPDNGATNLDNFNTNPGGDAGDWANSAAPDAALAFVPSGRVEPFTPTDIRVMDVLGWDVVAPTTNLTASNFVLSVTGTGSTSVSYQIHNTGSTTAGASTTGIYLSTDSIITTADRLLTTVSTPALAAGATDGETVSIVLPANLTPGTYYIGGYADYNGQISEISETDNASNAVAVILGNGSNNTLTGTAGADIMFGFAGNDTLDGGVGADVMAGGLGNDVFMVDNAGDVVIENAGQGTDAVETTLSSYTLGTNLENLTFIGAGNFNGVGNAVANIIIGGTGDDLLDGGAGNDTITGGGGADTLIGGLGNDTFLFASAADLGAAASIDGGAGTNTIKMTAAAILPDSDFAHVAAGTVQSLLLTGASSVILDLNAKNGGLNSVTTGASDTTITDDQGILISAHAAALTVGQTLTLNGSDTAHAASVTLGGGNLAANSHTGALTVTGGAGANTIVGGSGNDIITGGGGADTLIGGLGNDIFVFASLANLAAAASIDGGTGSNTIKLTAAASVPDSDFTHVAAGTVQTLQLTGASSVVLDLNAKNGGLNSVTAGAGDTTITDNQGILTSARATALTVGQTLTLNGSNTAHAASVTLSGGDLAAGSYTGALTVTGGAGANTIVGGSGSDTITGGGGVDTLTGGLGADKFVYAHVADSTVSMMDDITDFTQAQDQINLHAFLLSNHNVANATPLGGFQGDTTALGFFGTNSVVVQHFGGAEQVYVDVNHNGAFDPASDLVTHLDSISANLTGTDFIF